MRSDVPVITSTASSLPEVAGGASLLVDPLDVEQIIDAVRSVASNPALREDLISRGRQRVARLTWAENAREVGSVYKRTLGQ
jgi:glycosyltransferase involved in cell wall biosynthesis